METCIGDLLNGEKPRMCFTTELASVLGTHGQQCSQIEASDTKLDYNGNVKVYNELSGKAKFLQANSVHLNKKQICQLMPAHYKSILS